MRSQRSKEGVAEGGGEAEKLLQDGSNSNLIKRNMHQKGHFRLKKKRGY